MGHQIFTTERIGDFLRDTGYKSIESAISEIVDNSIEAKCSDCFIIIKETTEQRSVRTINYVSDIVFLDNGIGMDEEKLSACLSVGFTTREARTGMGRFGVGLPQSSLYACPSVDVYSWQNGYENCKKVFLDVDMVREGDQTEIQDPVATQLPSEYRKFLQYNTLNRSVSFKDQGTMVHWKNCDKVQPATANSLLKRLDFALGQKFRHLIKSGSQKIRIIKLNDEEKSYDILPNDPLMLMTPNYVMGNIEKNPLSVAAKASTCNEAIFEPYCNEMCPDGIVRKSVKYLDRLTGEIKKSDVVITFSIIKFDYYDPQKFNGRNPGSTALGDHLRRLEGVSIVRSGREIDFGKFDFYENINEPQHRWWGCEIAFNPELDEVFGVTNNKQFVDLKSGQEPIGDEIEPISDILIPIIKPTIKAMYARNEEIQRGTRGGSRPPISPSVDIVNTVETEEEKSDETSTPPTPPTDEMIDKGKKILEDIGVEPTEENARTFLGNKINVLYKNNGRGGPFFDYSFELNTAVVTINTEHIFYKEFFNCIKENQKTLVAFELFIDALIMAIFKTNSSQERENDNLMQIWEYKLKEYIREQCYPKSNIEV